MKISHHIESQELLDALKEALTWMETFRRFSRVPAGGPLCQSIAKTKAVLAQATERQVYGRTMIAPTLETDMVESPEITIP